MSESQSINEIVEYLNNFIEISFKNNEQLKSKNKLLPLIK